MWSRKARNVMLVLLMGVGLSFQGDPVKPLVEDAPSSTATESAEAGSPDNEDVVLVRCSEPIDSGENDRDNRDSGGDRVNGAIDTDENLLLHEQHARDARSLGTMITVIDNSSLVSTDASEPSTVAAPVNGSFATNFKLGVPYNFSHIFFLGGECDGIQPDWYYNFVSAGLNTLANAVIVCPPNPDNLEWWEREYNLIALDEVVRIAGDKLNETLVITVGVGLEVDWTPVAELLRRGMAFFHAKEDPIERLNFNLTEHGLSPSDILYLYFQWDEIKAAERNGSELCRLRKGSKQLKVAKIFFANRGTAPLDYRVDIALDVFREECPQVEVIEVWKVYDDIDNDALKATLLFNPLPDVVMTSKDEQARNFLNLAEEILTKEEVSQIVTTGWNNLERDLLNEQRILFTVDQLVHYPHEGIWRAIGTVVDIIQKTGLNSTGAIQSHITRENQVTITADTLTVSGDRAGYISSALLTGYNPSFPPYEDVRVSTGLFDVSITSMTPFMGYFEVVLWLKMSWIDPRLKWNPIIYEGQVPIDPTQIWTPKLFLENAFKRNDLYIAPAMVTYEGQVEMEINMRATFLCQTTEGLRSYPFDEYNCSIDLGSPQGVTMDQAYGFVVIDSDPHYETTYSTFLEHPDHHQDEDPREHRSTTVHYQLYFVRRPFTTYMRLIIPAILINMIGFMAFWIPELPESVALGITALLCSLAFRETVEMPDTANITWTEVFMLVNISYLASVMFIIWCSYSNSTRLGKKLNKLCLPCHPKTIAREIPQYAKKSIRGIAVSAHSSGDAKMEILRLDTDMDYDREVIKAPRKKQVALHNGDGPNNRSYRASRRDCNIMHDVDAELKFQRIKHDFNQHDFDNLQNHHDSDAEMKYNVQNHHDSDAEMKYDQGKSIRTKETNRDDMDGSLQDMSYSRNLAAADGNSEDPHWDSYQSLRGLHSNASPRAASNGVDVDIEVAPYAKQEARPTSTPRARRRTMVQIVKDKIKKQRDFETERERANVDWIGRWFVVPSYIIVIASLLLGGWGFK
jgi:Neurotransmitter-gated ion-channel ligand binding domain